jgi:2-hydroxychromene-2-carboxylate isomerase
MVPTALHSRKRSTSPALKERLKAECDAALAKGVFGSPYIIVDGEPFFGADRLPQIERWLASGGF